MARWIKSISLWLLAAGCALPAAAQEARYSGICDASAAIALGTDRFVVGEDEHNVLLIYRRDHPGSVEGVDLNSYLGTEPDEESDIEGAARIGDRIYWITSHGLDKNGEEKATRRRLFATDIIETPSGPTVKPLATPPYEDLLADLIAESKFRPLDLAAAAQKAPEKKHGFNIEGLAATPEGHLLIGFRNPRPGGKAIVIPITNPKEVVERRKKPVFDDAMLLDINEDAIDADREGRGIRSIERIGDYYLIVAGPFANNGSFAIYRWTGQAADKPKPLNADLGTLRPEALFAGPGIDQITILSDDGDERVGRKKCKNVAPDSKSFRAKTLPLQ